MSLEDLKKQFALDAQRDALKKLRRASILLCKANHLMDKFVEEFQITRIPFRRQAIVNEAINYLVADVLPNLPVAELASVQARLAVRDVGDV